MHEPIQIQAGIARKRRALGRRGAKPGQLRGGERQPRAKRVRHGAVHPGKPQRGIDIFHKHALRAIRPLAERHDRIAGGNHHRRLHELCGCQLLAAVEKGGRPADGRRTPAHAHGRFVPDCARIKCLRKRQQRRKLGKPRHRAGRILVLSAQHRSARALDQHRRLHIGRLLPAALRPRAQSRQQHHHAAAKQSGDSFFHTKTPSS